MGLPRRTGVKLGACKLASGARVSTHFHHTGEELFYRGTAGSGTIFFTSCNMRCAFCQNGDISTDKDNGEEVDARTLGAWQSRQIRRDRRRPTWLELDDSWRRARQLGLKFETATFERRAPFGMAFAVAWAGAAGRVRACPGRLQRGAGGPPRLRRPVSGCRTLLYWQAPLTKH